MQPIIENKTVLTEDLYMSGIKQYYKIGHRFSRYMAIAYAVVILGFAAFFLYDLNFLLGIPFLLISIFILFVEFRGYGIFLKKSFKKFAILHHSHYEVEITFRFYDKRLEQETDRTELGVEYKSISRAYDFPDVILLVYGKSVIIMDRDGFVVGSASQAKELMKNNGVKVYTPS